MCLMGAIDDATSELLPGAHFVEQECSTGYLRVLRDIVLEKGVPLSAYMDRHGSLKRNDKNWTLEEQLAGRQEPTQVKLALDDLGIQALYALSPQAKGRLERVWGTLQDRLVSELRLGQASTHRRGRQSPRGLPLRTQCALRYRASGCECSVALLPERLVRRGDLFAPPHAKGAQQQHGADWTADH
jgi:hypothetical protein